MLEVDPKLAAGYLCALFEHKREKVRMPDDWKKAMIGSIPKQCNLTQCDNFWRIFLLSVRSQVLGRVNIGRIEEGIEAKLRCEQAGFWEGKGLLSNFYHQKHHQPNIENCRFHKHV